jgi:hypothetical protein
MKNGVFWDVTMCGSCKNRPMVPMVFLHSVRRLLVTASVVPSSPIIVTLMKEALSSSETSVLTRITRRNIPENAILYMYIFLPSGNLVIIQIKRYLNLNNIIIGVYFRN